MTDYTELKRAAEALIAALDGGDALAIKSADIVYDMSANAPTIIQILEELERMREALRPFALCFMKPKTKRMMAHTEYDSEPLDEVTADGLTFGHLRAARSALEDR